ncbi:MAG: ABC transporter substrate-binding protein [Treponema sp.]|nr:ABC transporter substrate-binding protein [Treponema sp.]
MYFAQNRIAGKTYMVPVNMANVSGTALAIRGDLREKYGLPKINTMEDLEAYFEAVAADKNSGVSFAYHAAQDNKRLREIQFNQGNDFLIFAGALVDYFSYKYSSNVQPEDLFWIYSRPEYLEFLKTQKRFADIGAWSKSAVNNTTQMQDSFLNGISASFGNNLGTIGTVASQVAQAHPEWNPELVDLYPETNRFYLAATEGYAVPVSSQNQGRAFMSLDLLKFDENLYHLARNGIEGTHYTRPGPGLWMPGPAYDNYPFGVAISWGLKNKMYDLVRSDIFPDQKTISDDWNSRGIASPTASFAFDDRAVQNELANLRNIYLQHIPLLELGLVRDIEASLAEFQRQAEIAGLAKIAAEAQRQFKDHLDAMR